MQAKLLGIQSISFINNKGESISGTNIFLTFPDENVEGLRTEKFFLKKEIKLPKDTKLNDILNLLFNHKGRIEMIYKAD